MNILKCTNYNDILDIELNDKLYRYCLSLTCLFPSLSFVSILQTIKLFNIFEDNVIDPGIFPLSMWMIGGYNPHILK